MGRARSGKLRWLLVVIGWLVVLAVAFVLGYSLAGYDAERSLARIQALQIERDMLTEQLASQRDARTKLERSHQMDVAAQRAAQKQILQLEQELVRLQQQVTRLRALLGAGEQGVVEVDALVLTSLEDGWYRYRLTLSQLVPDFGQSEGEVVLFLVASSGNGRSVLRVSELANAAAGRHPMSFEHFQVFEGRFRLGTGVEPVDLIVEIVPKDDTLMASREVVGWKMALAAQSAPPPLPKTVPGVPAGAANR